MDEIIDAHPYLGLSPARVFCKEYASLCMRHGLCFIYPEGGGTPEVVEYNDRAVRFFFEAYDETTGGGEYRKRELERQNRPKTEPPMVHPEISKWIF